MSHFAVLVVGDDVEGQLAPYHEFECTGVVDQYVKSVDETEELRELFGREEKEALRRLSDGSLHSFFDDEGNWRPEFSAEVEEKGVFGRLEKRRTYHAPEGYERAKVPTSEVMSFRAWLAEWYGREEVQEGEEPDLEGDHKFGYTVVAADGSVVRTVDRTNPNSKWDWYEVGGRWTGFFKLRDGAAGSVGRPGLMTKPAGPGRADSALRRDVNLEGMRGEAAAKAGELWDKSRRILAAAGAAAPWVSWEQCLKDFDVDNVEGAIDRCREFYNSQPAVAALKASREGEFSWEVDDALAGSRAEYVAMGRERACSLYAVVYRGEWSARGTMGWFGCSHGEVDRDGWDRLLNELLDGLPGDTRLTVVDCHI